jgi:hypothetical protein
MEKSIYGVIASATGAAFDAVLKHLEWDDDEEEMVREFNPEYFENIHMMRVANNSKGNYDFVSFSRVDPFDIWKKYKRAYDRKGFGGFTEEFLDPYTSSDIFSGALYDAIMNENDYGREITHDTDFADNVLDRLGYLFNQMTRPSIIGQAKNWYKGYKGEETAYGKQSLGNEMVNTFLGIKVRNFDIKVSAVNKMKTKLDVLGDNNKTLISMMAKGESKEAIKAEIKDASIKANKIVNEARVGIDKMRKAGYSDEEIRAILESTRIDYKGDEKRNLKVFV